MRDYDADQPERKFQKYAVRGAYHWKMVSRNPRKHHPFLKARYQICLEMLAPIAGKIILDFGCGDGALAGFIAKTGGKIVGVDPNELGLELARQQFARHGLTGEFVSSSSVLPDRHFDAVVCADVIEHVADPTQIFEEIRRVLKPGGIAVVSTPIRLTELPIDPEHVREYFPSEFQALCEQFFDVIETRQALPVVLHEILYVSGIGGRLLAMSLGALSAWLNWNYVIKIKGDYRFYEVQFAKLRRIALDRVIFP